MTAGAPDLQGGEHPGSSDGFAFAVSGGLGAGYAARRAVLAGDGIVPASVRPDILLLVTELVTNAVRHAGAGPKRPVRVELMRRPRRVRVEVTDSGPGFERGPEEPSPNGSGGWGLVMVDRVADRWGIASESGTTCVWFEIRVEP
jgi:two-component sensor histidine kinase